MRIRGIEKRVTIIFLLSFLLFCIIALFVIFIEKASAELTVNANHNHIKIDFFYHGSTVSVNSTSDYNTDLIIKISSPDGRETLKQKGRVAGLLWMNTGTLKFGNVPNLYSVHSTKKVEDILDQREVDKYVLGYASLKKHVEITPAASEDEKTKWFDEFVKYKESSKLYANSFGKIIIEAKDSKQLYHIKTDWPYQAPPGEYLITVYAVKDKRVIEKAETKVLVEQVGIVKALANMAKDNGAIYGIISIIAALGAGFGVGMIFRKGGGSH